MWLSTPPGCGKKKIADHCDIVRHCGGLVRPSRAIDQLASTTNRGQGGGRGEDEGSLLGCGIARTGIEELVDADAASR